MPNQGLQIAQNIYALEGTGLPEFTESPEVEVEQGLPPLYAVRQGLPL